MNDRHRQVEKVQRTLARKPSLLDQFLRGTNFEAFRDASARLRQAWRDMATAITDAINAAAEELRNGFDWSALNAALAQIQKKD